jgi:adenylate cyclase
LQNSVGKLQLITTGFKKYVPPQIVNKLLVQQKVEFTPFVRHQKISTLFTDIKDFTAITELVTPKMLMHMLTIYMDSITDIIIKKKGTLDKYTIPLFWQLSLRYIGDSIMAFWNAPDPVHDFVYLSCLAAQEITQNVEKLSKQLKSLGFPELFTRAGVHYGDALVGNMGSHHRLNYTGKFIGVNHLL